MKILLSFGRVVMNLEGNPLIEDSNTILLSQILGFQLGNSIKGEPIKYYDWAKALYKDGSIEVDREDYDKLKKFVSELEISILIKAQLLECFILTPK